MFEITDLCILLQTACKIVNKSPTENKADYYQILDIILFEEYKLRISQPAWSVWPWDLWSKSVIFPKSVDYYELLNGVFLDYNSQNIICSWDGIVGIFVQKYRCV